MDYIKDFWQIYERGELYAVKGELVQLIGYRELYSEAVFENGDGEVVTAYMGQIRSARTLF